MPIRKNHGSISSTDSGHSEAMLCEGNGNLYHLTSSILHNAPLRRHSAVQPSSNSSNFYHQHLIQTNAIGSSTKQTNGDISLMPPPNSRRPVPFPSIPVLPTTVNAFNMYSSQQQQLQHGQIRHGGMV